MRAYYSTLMERAEPDTVGKMKQFATYFTPRRSQRSQAAGGDPPGADAAEILERVDRFFEGELSVARHSNP